MNLKNGIPKDARDVRYLGVSYHFNDAGNIATCSHIVNSLKDGETLVAMELHGQRLAFKVEDIRCHPKYDFAVGFVARGNYIAIPIHGSRDIYIGDDVMAYGYTSDGVVDGAITASSRLFKGHIVRTYHVPILKNSRSICEISFPSLNGFSGTPLLFSKSETSICGMLFSNFESTIELHKVSEIEESGNKYSEEIHKVIELGVAHTAYDIRVFLNDLNVSRIALDTASPDEVKT